MFGQLRNKLQSEAGELWRDLSDQAGPGAASAELTRQRWPQFEALIEFDNKRLAESLLPAYRKMVTLFREKLWLADAATREYYPELAEFVDVWERWVTDSLPPELIGRMGHTEVRLRPFYEHIEVYHDRLRDAVSSGDPEISQIGGSVNIPENVKVSLNQNLWGLLLSFGALGASEYFHLTVLFWLASVASVAMLLSVIVTTAAYTIRYCKNKLG
jgi:hypothetical protein